jgi:hypothetical protein
VGEQVPQIRGASVTQDRRFATCEQRSLFDGEWWRDLVPDQVHPTVNLMKATVTKPEVNLVNSDARLKQLPSRYDAMLTSRERPNDAFRKSTGRFTGHNPVKPTLDPHAPVGCRYL